MTQFKRTSKNHRDEDFVKEIDKKMKVSIKQLAYELLFILVLTNNIISNYIPFFSYFDEAILFWALLKLIRKRNIRNSVKTVLFLLIGITVIGFCGLWINGYQKNGIAVVKDLMLLYKFPIIMCALIENNIRGISTKRIIKIIDIYASIILFFGLVSLFVDIGMSQTYDIRFGIAPYQFLYSHPTFLAYALIMMSIVYISNMERWRQNIFVQCEILLSLLLTLRDKAFAYILLYVLFIYIVPNRKKIKTKYLVIAGIGAILVSFNKIQEYFSFSWSPRIGMYKVAFSIMMSKFPIGLGLASFGSSVSGEYYSNAYYIYNLSEKFTLDSYIGLSDSQWPYYMGQFGILGTILFFIILLVLFKETRAKCESSLHEKGAWLMFGYILVASIVESFFTNESGATIGMSVLLYVKMNSVKRITGHGRKK